MDEGTTMGTESVIEKFENKINTTEDWWRKLKGKVNETKSLCHKEEDPGS